MHQIDTGTFMKPGKTTLGEFLERWLKDYARPNLSPRTAEGYESMIRRHLIPKLGKILLTQLKPEHIQKYYSDYLAEGRCNGKGGLDPLTVRHHHMALHRALQIAVKWGVISNNPADAIDPPRFQRSEIRIMNEDDIRTFLEAAKHTAYYALFYLTLFMGMRRSEILALRWSDADLLLGQISVNRSLHHLRDRRLVFRAPKTASGRRTISLPLSAVLVLKEHKERQGDMNLVLGTLPKESELVFSQPDGAPLLPDTVSHVWSKLARRLGLGATRLHDARHTHASLMLKQGIHPKVVQERLGHTSIQATLDTYSHIAPGLQEAAALRFDEAFNRRQNTAAEERVS